MSKNIKTSLVNAIITRSDNDTFYQVISVHTTSDNNVGLRFTSDYVLTCINTKYGNKEIILASDVLNVYTQRVSSTELNESIIRIGDYFYKGCDKYHITAITFYSVNNILHVSNVEFKDNKDIKYVVEFNTLKNWLLNSTYHSIYNNTYINNIKNNTNNTPISHVYESYPEEIHMHDLITLSECKKGWWQVIKIYGNNSIKTKIVMKNVLTRKIKTIYNENIHVTKKIEFNVNNEYCPTNIRLGDTVNLNNVIGTITNIEPTFNDNMAFTVKSSSGISCKRYFTEFSKDSWKSMTLLYAKSTLKVTGSSGSMMGGTGACGISDFSNTSNTTKNNSIKKEHKPKIHKIHYTKESISVNDLITLKNNKKGWWQVLSIENKDLLKLQNVLTSKIINKVIRIDDVSKIIKYTNSKVSIPTNIRIGDVFTRHNILHTIIAFDPNFTDNMRIICKNKTSNDNIKTSFNEIKTKFNLVSIYNTKKERKYNVNDIIYFKSDFENELLTYPVYQIMNIMDDNYLVLQDIETGAGIKTEATDVNIISDKNVNTEFNARCIRINDTFKARIPNSNITEYKNWIVNAIKPARSTNAQALYTITELTTGSVYSFNFDSFIKYLYDNNVLYQSVYGIQYSLCNVHELCDNEEIITVDTTKLVLYKLTKLLVMLIHKCSNNINKDEYFKLYNEIVNTNPNDMNKINDIINSVEKITNNQ